MRRIRGLSNSQTKSLLEGVPARACSLFFFGVLLTTLTGCPKGNVKNGNDPSKKPQFKTITDLAVCQGAPQFQSPVGNWSVWVTDGKQQQQHTLELNLFSTKLSVTCSDGGQWKTATVVSPSALEKGFVHILASRDSAQGACEASMHEGHYAWALNGTCLTLSQWSGVETFVRAKSSNLGDLSEDHPSLETDSH